MGALRPRPAAQPRPGRTLRFQLAAPPEPGFTHWHRRAELNRTAVTPARGRYYDSLFSLRSEWRSICCHWHAPAHLARWLRVLSLHYATARLCRHTHEIRCNQSTFGRPPPCRATIRLSWQRCVPAACCLAHTEPLRPGAESSRGELATVSRVVRCSRKAAAQELGPVCRPTALRACVIINKLENCTQIQFYRMVIFMELLPTCIDVHK